MYTSAVQRETKPYYVLKNTKHSERVTLESKVQREEEWWKKEEEWWKREEERATNNSRSVLHHLLLLRKSVAYSNVSGSPQ